MHIATQNTSLPRQAANGATHTPARAEASPLAGSVDAHGPRPYIRIAYLGGGSREWAGKLMADLALTSRITGRLVLHDIDTEAARRNVQLAGEIFSHPDARTTFDVVVEDDIARALKGADFVVISIEPGPTEMRFADLEIPARYGVLQTVGDTTGPGGILRALRTVPIYKRFAHAIMEHCPQAWVINYTNPMALCVAALHAYAPGIRAFGCCHEVFGTQTMLAGHVHKWFHVQVPNRTHIELEIAGVNHFTWATRATWRGHDLLACLRETIAGDPSFFTGGSAFAAEGKAAQRWFDSKHLIACDLLRRFGALGAAGDRHLAEFVPWYLTSEDELHRWGVVATPYSWRLERSRKAPTRLGAFTAGLSPSGEEGVEMIEALLGLRTMRTNVNLLNTGQMPEVRAGAVVETYAYFAAGRVTPLVAQPLPAPVLGLVQGAVAEQSMVLQAALQGDMDLAFQAMLVHPLVRIPTDRAWQMFHEMREVVGHMLPRGV